MLLAVILMVLTIAPISSAQRRYYRHHRPSKTKHIAVGTAIGAVGGALLGGKKGALIGAGAGAAAGTGAAYATGKKDVAFGAERLLTFKTTQPLSVQI